MGGGGEWGRWGRTQIIVPVATAKQVTFASIRHDRTLLSIHDLFTPSGHDWPSLGGFPTDESPKIKTDQKNPVGRASHTLNHTPTRPALIMTAHHVRSTLTTMSGRHDRPQPAGGTTAIVPVVTTPVNPIIATDQLSVSRPTVAPMPPPPITFCRHDW